MAKLKEITFAYKKGLENYSSVNTGVTFTIQEGDDLDKVWEEARKMCVKEAEIEASWLREESEAEKAQKERNNKYRKEMVQSKI